MVLTPDCMLSDGSVARLQELAQGACNSSSPPPCASAKSRFWRTCVTWGSCRAIDRGKTGSPVTITGRQMVHAAVNGFHSETLAYEWDAPGIMAISPAAWWRVPGRGRHPAAQLELGAAVARLRCDRRARYVHIRPMDARRRLPLQQYRRTSSIFSRPGLRRTVPRQLGPACRACSHQDQISVRQILGRSFFQTELLQRIFRSAQTKAVLSAGALAFTTAERKVERHRRPRDERTAPLGQTAGTNKSEQRGFRTTVLLRRHCGSNLPLSGLRTLAYVWIFRRRIASAFRPHAARRPRQICAHRLVCALVRLRRQPSLAVPRQIIVNPEAPMRRRQRFHSVCPRERLAPQFCGMPQAGL